MRQFKTERRLEKIRHAANWRQESLRVVFENIHDPHNVSAILRSCDAVGVQKVGLVYNTEKFPKLSKVTSSSANKWIDVEKYKSVEDSCDKLKSNGYKIYASMLDENAVGLYDLDLTERVAIIMGNEHRGVSEDFQKLADKTFYIPMRGMIQSLNVSVAAAVILYEAQRQRLLRGMYNSNSFSNVEIEELIDRWCEK
jgi:tRNA (guanosine-2'-O-)-methyltransferase